MPQPPSAAPVPGECDGPTPALLSLGISQFNAGQFYECHETLEDLWQPAAGPARELYQGILQLGVGCHHAGQGNAQGAQALLARGIARLRGLPSICQGVRIDRLLADAVRFADAVAAGRAAQEPYPQVELI